MVNTQFDSTPTTPSPEISPEKLTMRLISLIDSYNKNAHLPDEKAKYRDQLDKLASLIQGNPDSIIRELDRKRKEEYVRLMSRQEEISRKTVELIPGKITLISPDTHTNMYAGWDNRSATVAIKEYRDNALPPALRIQAQETTNLINTQRHETIQSQTVFIERFSLYSQARGFVLGLPSKPTT